MGDITGYSIYKGKAENMTIKNEMPELYPAFPNKKYSIIYADPPRDYGGKMQFDKSSIKSENLGFERDIFISSASFKYPTMKTSQMKKIPILDIAENDCLLFMWSTNPHLAQAVDLGTSWGFEYKTVAFVWNKMMHNPGQYTLSYCELCLLFKRGRIPTPRGARNVKQLVEVPRGEHSAKPDEVRKRIEAMFPSQSKIELFARNRNLGRDSRGLDVLNL